MNDSPEPEPNLALWLIGMVAVGAILLLLAALMSFARAEEPVTPSVAYCALYSREAVRIDLMHTIPVSPGDVTDSYIEALAVRVFQDCVSILPTLLPLPEAHRNLDSWIIDMRYLIMQRVGTAPATAEPIAGDEEWRRQCAATYRTWDEETGTVIRRGSHERTECPCGKGVTCDEQ